VDLGREEKKSITKLIGRGKKRNSKRTLAVKKLQRKKNERRRQADGTRKKKNKKRYDHHQRKANEHLARAKKKKSATHLTRKRGKKREARGDPSNNPFKKKRTIKKLPLKLETHKAKRTTNTRRAEDNKLLKSQL